MTREEIESLPGLRKAHFLNPNAVRVNKSLGDLTGLTGLGFHLVEVAPGHETTEHHLHHHEDECVFILSGQATAVSYTHLDVYKRQAAVPAPACAPQGAAVVVCR